MGRATISQITTNLYSVPMIFVLKIQNDFSNRTKAITQNPLCRQMDDPPITLYDHNLKMKNKLTTYNKQKTPFL